MIKVELYNASNGIVKKIIDTESTKKQSENYKIYEIFDDFEVDLKNTVSMFEDVCADLALSTGSDYDANQLNFIIDWGDKYVPTKEEINIKIKTLRQQIKDLKDLKLLL
jgi:hypothetical protein